MIRISLLLVGIALVFAMPSAAHAGACASPRWSPVIITPANQAIPAGGGVLVGARSGFGGPASSLGVRSSRRTPSMVKWHLRQGKRIVRFRVDHLAPGLTRYVPTQRIRGKWIIAPTKPTRVVSFTRGRRPRMAAPTVVSFTRSTSKWKNHRGYNRTTLRVSVELAATAPRDAVGVIVYRQARKLVPLMFKRIGAAARLRRLKSANSIVLYTSPGRCQSRVPGIRIPHAGAMVQLRWVDRFGWLSPLSKPMKVKAR